VPTQKGALHWQSSSLSSFKPATFMPIKPPKINFFPIKNRRSFWRALLQKETVRRGELFTDRE
jgi:hypothetical protein